jgi:hypothetical protein
VESLSYKIATPISIAIVYCTLVFGGNGYEITCGRPFEGEINPGTEIDGYYFTGEAGDKISIRLAPHSSRFPDSRLQLIAPNDTLLKTQEAYNGNLNAIEDCILPVSGTYTIRVFEIQGDRTFKYTLGLYSAQQGVSQEETLQLMKPVSGNRQFADNNTVQSNQRQLLSTDTKGDPIQDLSGIISTGKALGATGILLWGTGKAFEIIGLSVMFSGAVEGHISNENFFTGFSLVMSGAVLDLFGAIPACIGESIVMRSIKKSNISLNDQDFKLYSKGGALYAASWSLLGLGVCMNILAATTNTLPLVFIGIAASGTAEVLRGVAAIVPLVRVGKAQRILNLRVSPTMDWKGNVGLGLAGVF